MSKTVYHDERAAVLTDREEEELVRNKFYEFSRLLRKQFGAKTLNNVIDQHQRLLPNASSYSVSIPFIETGIERISENSSMDPSYEKSSRKRRNIDASMLCREENCHKLDKGGGYCIKHGGGPRCKRSDCTRGGVLGSFCVKHGGGIRCTYEGCTKGSAGRGLCRAHGGGKRCAYINQCNRPALSNTNFCREHGGGILCKVTNCSKLAQGGPVCMEHGGNYKCSEKGCRRTRSINGLCKVHGGQGYCKVEECRTLAIGNSKLCILHGGGRRCKIEGCGKAAVSRGFCTRHGGGARCSFDGCNKAKPGGSQFCCGHGGGRRCTVENCGKLDQGGGKCKAHGGGKRLRCIYEQCSRVAITDTSYCSFHIGYDCSNQIMEPDRPFRNQSDNISDMKNRCIEPGSHQVPLSYGNCRDHEDTRRANIECSSRMCGSDNTICSNHVKQNMEGDHSGQEVLDVMHVGRKVSDLDNFSQPHKTSLNHTGLLPDSHIRCAGLYEFVEEGRQARNQYIPEHDEIVQHERNHVSGNSESIQLLNGNRSRAAGHHVNVVFPDHYQPL